MIGQFESHALRQPLADDAPSSGLMLFIKRRWKSMVLCTVLAMGGAYAFLHFATPKYTSTAMIYVQPPVALGAAGTSGKAAGVTTRFLNTQREILGSLPVLAIAAQNDKLQPITSELTDTIGFFHEGLKVSVGTDDDLIRVSFQSANDEDARIAVESIIDGYTRYQTGQTRNPRMKLLEAVQVRKNEFDYAISEKAKDMRDIQRMVGALSFTPAARDKISERLLALKENIQIAKQDILKARIQYEKAVAACGNDSLADQKLDEDAMLAKAVAPSGDSAASTQPAKTNDPARAFGVFASDADLNQMSVDLVTFESQLQDLNKRYLPAHPSIKETRDRIELTRTRYLSATRWRLKEARSRETQFQSAFDDEMKSAEIFVYQSERFAEIERQRKELEDSASLLRSKIKDLRQEEEANISSIQVVEIAKTGVRSWPNPRLVYCLALAAGLLGGIGLGLIRHRTDPQFHSADELESSIDLPVLGTIPGVSKTESILNVSTNSASTGNDRYGDFYEVCRRIAGSVNVLWPKGSTPALLVTSPEKGQGRSTVARDLAIAMADSGDKVLLIDADYNNPSLHKLVGTKNTDGLSTIVGGEISLESAVALTSIPRLDVLTSGPEPTATTAMFDSPEFESLLVDAASRYDRVIVDASSVNQSNDARIAAQACGAALVVMPQENLNKRAIQQTRDRLIGFGANIIGVVFNESMRRRVKSKEVAKPIKIPTTLKKISKVIVEEKIKETEKVKNQEKEQGNTEKAKKRATASLFRSLK